MNIFIKQFFRQFRHQKVYAAIYLGSLIVSILAAYLIYTYVYQELRTDQFHSNRENIYRVLAKWKNNNQWMNTTPYPLAAELNSRSPEIVNYTQFRNY
ncbi:MAG: ABC transporter permease, partial [Candidatus Cloacimonetes bacterium]|nr:ABC transporter permease [Candidatus Cloacimonadota bacterium]